MNIHAQIVFLSKKFYDGEYHKIFFMWSIENNVANTLFNQV